MASRVRVKSESVLEILQGVADWELFYGPTGQPLFRVPASRGGTYTVSVHSCTCPSDQYGKGQRCKHVSACRVVAKILTADRGPWATQKEKLRGDSGPSDRGNKPAAGVHR
jgi:hypothetical protein